MLNYSIDNAADDVGGELPLGYPGVSSEVTYSVIGYCVEQIRFDAPIMPAGFWTETGPVQFASSQTIMTSVS